MEIKDKIEAIKLVNSYKEEIDILAKEQFNDRFSEYKNISYRGFCIIGDKILVNYLGETPKGGFYTDSFILKY